VSQSGKSLELIWWDAQTHDDDVIDTSCGGDGVSVVEPHDWVGAWGRLDPALASRKPANAVASDSLEPPFSAFAALLTIDDADTIVGRAIELARDQIGLVRASIRVAADVRAEAEAHHHTVFDEFLIVEHRRGDTNAGHRRTITCTPIRCGEWFMGMMVNDSGALPAPLDRVKQAQAAILCSLLGTTLRSLAATPELRVHHLLMAAVAMLLEDPAVGREDIARRLGIGSQRVTRMFESGLGISLPDYRNRLRLERFTFLVANGAASLPDAAVAAGFKSHTHCQQVSRAFRWMACLKRLTQ
jgi:AraC-like DNA-binding protein